METLIRTFILLLLLTFPISIKAYTQTVKCVEMTNQIDNMNPIVIKVCQSLRKANDLNIRIYRIKHGVYGDEFRRSRLNGYLQEQFSNEVRIFNKELETAGLTNRMDMSDTAYLNICNEGKAFIQSNYSIKDLLRFGLVSITFRYVANYTPFTIEVNTEYEQKLETRISADDYYESKIRADARRGFKTTYVYSKDEVFTRTTWKNGTNTTTVFPFEGKNTFTAWDVR